MKGDDEERAAADAAPGQLADQLAQLLRDFGRPELADVVAAAFAGPEGRKLHAQIRLALYEAGREIDRDDDMVDHLDEAWYLMSQLEPPVTGEVDDYLELIARMAALDLQDLAEVLRHGITNGDPGPALGEIDAHMRPGDESEDRYEPAHYWAWNEAWNLLGQLRANGTHE